MKNNFLLTFILFYFSIVSFANAYLSYTSCSKEKNLTSPKEKLFHDVVCELNSYERPVKDQNIQMYVNLTFAPVYLSLSEEQKMVRVDGYLVMKWSDQNAVWRPGRYNNIQFIKTNYYDIWYPKITAYDSGSQYKFLDEMDKIRYDDPRVYYNGSVVMRGVGTFYGPCSADTSGWPFEEWKCTITLAKTMDEDGLVSVTFDGYRDIDVHSLETSNLWEIVSVPYFWQTSNEQYIELRVTLQRHVSHYQAIFVYPGIILLALSLLSFLLSTQFYCRMLINMLTALMQMTFTQEIFTLLEENGTNGVALYSFYLDGMLISVFGVLFAVINAKLLSKADDPPQVIIEMLGVVAAVPFCGPVISYMINENTNITADDDEVGLVNAGNKKYSQKWRIVANFLDLFAFVVILLYIVLYYGLMV